jgi:hypothetical protein
MFDPSTEMWTWVSGEAYVDPQGSYGSLRTPDYANSPPPREDASMWIGTDGSLWLFGGAQFPTDRELSG